MSKTFDFTQTKYIQDWTGNKEDVFRLNSNGLELQRTLTGESNILAGTTLVAETGTTINGGSSATDWEKATICMLQGTDVQEVTVDFGSGNTKYVRRLAMQLVQQDPDETFGAVEFYVSEDNTVWTKRPIEQDTSDPIIDYFDIQEGTACRYIKLVFHGTSLNTDEIRFREVYLFQSVYPTPFQLVRSNQELYTNTLTGVTGNVTETGSSELKVQLLKQDLPYYWDGSSWVSCGGDTTRYNEFSNTIADANTNIASFLPGSGDDIKVGVQLVYVPELTTTPACEDITLTTT